MRDFTNIIIEAGIVALGAFALSGCSTAKKILAIDPPKQQIQPTENPFSDYTPAHVSTQNQAVVLSTKKGDRSVEVQLPGNYGDMTDFVAPVSPGFREG